ncbi:hypothetical protein LCGC14_1004340 [marine sediment metagenome]|uniref:Uncharacterized protein n=1 Tax=marine sediment metagenome TaxID=412755 RepID=A0A0F9QKE1_9ZZZZ
MTDSKIQQFRYLEYGTYLFIAIGAFIIWGWGLWRSVN